MTSVTGRSYTHNFFEVQYIIIQVIFSRKSMKKIEIIFQFCLPAGCECTLRPIAPFA